MRSRSIALAATALSVAWCGSAWADEANEKALQQKVDDLQKQIDDLSKRVGDGSNRAGDELASRVDELEKLTRKDKDGLFGYWANGVRMDSANGAFKLKIGGRIQSDWTFFDHTSAAEDATGKQIEAGEEFRRLRLMMGGTIYNNVEFSNEYDFAGGAVVPRDVWIALKKLPFTATVGQFKEPTGTEELTSDLFIPFLERSAGNEAFAPDYKTGVMLSDTCCGDLASWQAAITRNSAASGNSTGNARSGDYNYTGRIAGKPWTGDDNQQYATVGLAGSIRSPAGDSNEFAAHPELHIGPKWVDTKAFSCDREELIELDGGLVAGPFWAYADYFHVGTRGKDGGKDHTFTAWSLSAGFFLTGEVKPYKASNSTYDRITPKKNFDGNGGMGAWEIVARVDQLDLNDKDVDGGKEEMWTLGVSWWLNPNTRWMLDWVHAKQKDLSVNINGLEMRFQIDF